jgi:hypothetical protein
MEAREHTCAHATRRECVLLATSSAFNVLKLMRVRYFHGHVYGMQVWRACHTHATSAQQDNAQQHKSARSSKRILLH